MMIKHAIWTSAAIGLSLVGFSGCGGPSPEYKPAKDIPTVAHEEHHHEHAEGPHHGTIVELGQEEFHAEIVVDDKGHALRVYLLGPDAKTDATTAAADLTVTIEGGATFTLKPVAGSPEGQHAAFEMVDEKAVHEIAEAGYIHGTLVVKIGEKNFSAELDVHFDGDHSMHEGEAKPAEPAAPAQP